MDCLIKAFFTPRSTLHFHGNRTPTYLSKFLFLRSKKVSRLRHAYDEKLHHHQTCFLNTRIVTTVFCYICPVFINCSQSRVLHIQILKERIRPISFPTIQLEDCSAKINAIIIRIPCMEVRSSAVVRCLISKKGIRWSNG